MILSSHTCTHFILRLLPGAIARLYSTGSATGRSDRLRPRAVMILNVRRGVQVRMVTTGQRDVTTLERAGVPRR